MKNTSSTYFKENLGLVYTFAIKILCVIFLFNAVPVIELVDIISSQDEDIEIIADYTFSEKKEIEEEEVVLNEMDYVVTDLIGYSNQIISLKPVLFVQGVIIPPPESV